MLTVAVSLHGTALHPNRLRGEALRHPVRRGPIASSMPGQDNLEVRTAKRTRARPATPAAKRAWADARLRPIRGEYPFASHFLELDGGVYMHYIDEGPSEAEALLFLHGNPTWSFAWRGAVRRLSKRYRCIAFDHVGCGLSDKPANYSYRLAAHIENARRLVLGLELERFSLVAHDWGGTIAMGLARRLPERVARIALANTAAFPFPRMPWRIAACRVPVLGKLAVRGLNAFARAATFMTVETPLHPTVKLGYLLPYDNYANRVAVAAFVDDIPMAPDHPSRGELEAIAHSLRRFQDRPIRLLWGMRDWCFTNAFLEEWVRIWPRAQVRRFEEAGHFVFEDAPERFAAELDDFLSGSTSAP